MKRSTIAALAVIGLTGGALGTGVAVNAAAPSGALESRGPITIWLSNNTVRAGMGHGHGRGVERRAPRRGDHGAGDPGRAHERGGHRRRHHGRQRTVPHLQHGAGCGAAVPAPGRAGRHSTASPTAPTTSPRASGDRAEQYRSPDGGLYQMPWKANPVMIIYNRAIFEEAGLDPDNPPLATYDEFLATAQTLVDEGGVQAAIWPSPAGEFFQPWFDFYPTVHRPERTRAGRGRGGDVRLRRRLRRRRLLAQPLRRRA